MQLCFWERAKAACYVYFAYVRNAVAAILNLILSAEKDCGEQHPLEQVA